MQPVTITKRKLSVIILAVLSERELMSFIRRLDLMTVFSINNQILLSYFDCESETVPLPL
jgi:hypothetical protein